MKKKPICTIGYQYNSIVMVLETMKQKDIDLLVDVRSWPYSRNPKSREFNKNRLEERLGERYLWIGELCGGKSGKPVFQTCIKKIHELNKKQGLILMCMEDHPCDCHRLYDISRRLLKMGVEPTHIFGGQERKTTELDEAHCRARRKR